jgi:hypothetical protein
MSIAMDLQVGAMLKPFQSSGERCDAFGLIT